MNSKTQKSARIFVGILLGAILTGLFSFSISYFISYNSLSRGSDFISFKKESGAFLGGIVGAVLDVFGGLILGGIIGAIRSGKGKSAIIGGITNMLIPSIFINATNDGGQNTPASLLVYILGQLIAGGIAGLLISLFFSFATKKEIEKL